MNAAAYILKAIEYLLNKLQMYRLMKNRLVRSRIVVIEKSKLGTMETVQITVFMTPHQKDNCRVFSV